MVSGLQGQWILHQHAEQTAGEVSRLHLDTDTPEDLQATDFVPGDGGAKRESEPISSAIDGP